MKLLLFFELQAVNYQLVYGKSAQKAKNQSQRNKLLAELKSNLFFPQVFLLEKLTPELDLCGLHLKLLKSEQIYKLKMLCVKV